VQAVVILTHDVMEQVQQAHVQQHVEHENGVQHEVRVVVTVQLNQVIHILLVMVRIIIVIGRVIVDTIKNQVVVSLIVRLLLSLQKVVRLQLVIRVAVHMVMKILIRVDMIILVIVMVIEHGMV